MAETFKIVGLRFPSFYLQDYEKAAAFYTEVFGEPETNEEAIKGWYLGDTWLTLFPSVGMAATPGHNPRNAEFAIQVETPGQVDRLYTALLKAGAKVCMAPEDTEMYIPMRFCCVDDPFGIRVDVFCPVELPTK